MPSALVTGPGEMTPRSVSVAELVTAVRAVTTVTVEAPRRPTFFIGIDGFGAAGKSSLARQLAREISGASVVSIDDFGRRDLPAWDWDRFTDQVLIPLRAGRPARYQRWDWDGNVGTDWFGIEPGAVVLVEGVSCTRSEVAVPWALRIWVDTPAHLRRERILHRDGPERQVVWAERWIPSEQAWAHAQRPWDRADLIVSGATASSSASGESAPE